MDVGSILSNAISGIIASLFVLLLVGMGKQIQAKSSSRDGLLRMLSAYCLRTRVSSSSMRFSSASIGSASEAVEVSRTRKLAARA